MAYVFSLFAAVTVQKNVRDKQAFEPEETATLEPIQDDIVTE